MILRRLHTRLLCFQKVGFHAATVLDEQRRTLQQPRGDGLDNSIISTGIEMLDRRLGGLVEGRYYLLGGEAGAGKTSVALHFLGAGLDAGETCAILTQEDPGDLIGQAEFLGYDFRTPAENNQLIVLQYRLDFAHNYTRVADPGRLVDELRDLTEHATLDRFVIDSISPFLDVRGSIHDTVEGLLSLLEGVGATTYLTAPGDISAASMAASFERLRTGAAGVFHLEAATGNVRDFVIRKVRQTASSTEPFQFSIQPGLGVVAERETGNTRQDLPPEARKRLILLRTTAELPDEFLAALEAAYELEVYDTVESAFGELVAGQFGALIQVFDSRQPAPAIKLTRELRRAGSGAPILYFTPESDLRASTRAKGLRAGGDDFLTDALSAQEFMERVEVARVRGFRVPEVPDGADNILMQPSDDSGEPVMLDEREIRRGVQHQMRRSSHPFFAIAFLRPPEFMPEMWKILCEHLRVQEGDLVGRSEDGRVVVYLHDVSRKDVRDLLARIVELNPEFAMVEDVTVYSYPTDRTEVESWLEEEERLQRTEAPG